MTVSSWGVGPGVREVERWIAQRYAGFGAEWSAEACGRSYPLLWWIAEGAVWLRMYASRCDARERLEAQARAATDLASLGAAVVRPIAGRDDRFVQTFDESRVALMFTHAAGRCVDRSRAEEVGALGVALAQMHVRSSAVDVPELATVSFASLADSPLDRLSSWPAATTVVDEARELAEHMRARVEVELPTGLCHGDVHTENAAIDDAGRVMLFDLDQLARGPFAYDLGCYWRKCILGHTLRRDAELEWHAFLDGYERVRALTNEEREAIPAFATLRAIWTMALPTQFVGIWGDDWLADPEYFAAHAQWIRTFAAASG